MHELQDLSSPLAIRLQQALVNLLYFIKVYDHVERTGFISEDTDEMFLQMEYQGEVGQLLEKVDEMLLAKPALGNQFPELRKLITGVLDMTEYYLSYDKIALFVRERVNYHFVFTPWLAKFQARMPNTAGRSDTYLYFEAQHDITLKSLVLGSISDFIEKIEQINCLGNQFRATKIQKNTNRLPYTSFRPLWMGSQRSFQKTPLGQYRWNPTEVKQILEQAEHERIEHKQARLRSGTRVDYRKFFK